MRRVSPAGLIVVGAPLLWLALFVLVPGLIVLAISLARPVLDQPPFEPLLAWTDGAPRLQATLRSYVLLATDDLYVDSALASLRIAALSTAAALLLGYPLALAVARSERRWRGPLLLLVVLPFWTSFLIRVYAWMGILADEGPVNALLLGLGLVEAPLQLLYTEGAAVVGIVYAYLPFMVLPLVAVLERHDPALVEAAADLGCRPWQAFRRVTLPLSLPGVLAGCLLVFVPALGEFVVPELLGGSDAPTLGRMLWTEFFANRDWPVAAALAVLLMLLLVAPVMLLQRRPAAGG